MFGGSGPKNTQALLLNSESEQVCFWTLDLKTYKWEAAPVRGESPTSRDDHTALVYENSQMIVFGGFTTDGERTNQVLKYHFKEGRWDFIESADGVLPKPRAGHSAVIHGHNMVIFGGRDEDN